MANYSTVARLGDPSSEAWKRANLTWINQGPERWQVYKEAAPAFQGLLNELAASGYTPTSSGGYNYRNIRGGNTLSQHAFGTAIDINAAANALGSRRTNIPNAAALAEKYGLEWGGNWKRRPDPMHFEWRGPSAAGGQLPEQPVPQGGVSETVTPPFGPSTVMQGLMAGQGDWMQNRSYSADALMADFFAGRNPLRRWAYQKVASLFA